MAPCQKRIELPIRAESFTGLARDQVICDIGAHSGIKHFLHMYNWRYYPVQVEVIAQVISEPPLIRFEQDALHPQIDVNDSEWSKADVLDPSEELDLSVNLQAVGPPGVEQMIEVSLVVLRLHADPFDPASLAITVRT